MGSLTSCDPGDIYESIEDLVKDNVRVSIVGLSAEVQICKYICKRTKGIGSQKSFCTHATDSLLIFTIEKIRNFLIFNNGNKFFFLF